MNQHQEMAALVEDVRVTLASLPGPHAITEHLMGCREADCRVCRGCAALLSNAQQRAN
jgi:hypothetical protein